MVKFIAPALTGSMATMVKSAVDATINAAMAEFRREMQSRPQVLDKGKGKQRAEESPSPERSSSPEVHVSQSPYEVSLNPQSVNLLLTLSLLTGG